jgi:hypothetical protein
MVFEAVIAFENKGDDRKIDVDLTAAGETGTLDLLIKKTAKGLEFEGAIHIPGSDDVTITGWQETAGDDISGSFKLSSPSADVMSIDYEGTIFIGKPKEAVKDDSRFEVDTDDAAVIDFEDSLEENFSQDFTGIPSLGMGN